MAILDILKFPDPRLRRKSMPVQEVTEEHADFSRDLLETMYSFKGIGLAAPQVNKLIRMVVIDTRRPEENEAKELRYELGDATELEQAIEQPLVLINPKITSKKGKTTYDEGCLSVPSYYETVERFEYIEVEAFNEKGEKLKIKTDGLLAICIQHEIDHLDGKLFIDRLSPIKSNKIKNKIKKFGYPSPESKYDEE